MKIHFCWINRKYFWVIEKWIISPAMCFSFHFHSRFNVWFYHRCWKIDRILICKFFLSFFLNHWNLEGVELYDFFEDSICLMLRNISEISSGNLFKLSWTYSTVNEITSRSELHVVVSICISWTKSIEKNLIKIWKWLHAVFKNHPHE